MFLKCLGFSCSKHINSDSPSSDAAMTLHTRLSKRPYQTVIEELCHQFSLADLKKATNNFDKNQLIRSKGFSVEYKGCLQHDVGVTGTVAVKRMHQGTGQGLREFMNEIELLCQLHHPNLITLIGFCNHKDEKILVYEYMSNGSLYDHLHSIHMEPLSWKKRLEVCIGAACGLHYLHTGTKRTILHCHIDPNSILLDNNMVSKISSFGLALQGPHFTSKSKPKPIPDDEFTSFIGTYGYTAPEVLQNMTFTDKSDVWSFGKVLLEVVCTDNKLIWTGYPIEQSIDPKIKGHIAPACWEVFLDITKRCLKWEPDERPAMGEVELQLECALSLQEEADSKKTNGDYYYLLTTTTITNLLQEETSISCASNEF